MSDLTTNNMFVSELLEEMNVSSDADVNFKHPFSCQEVKGYDLIKKLAEHIQSPVGGIELGPCFSSDDVVAKCWTVAFAGDTIQGVTTVVAEDGDYEVRILLNTFPKTREWREAVRSATGDLMQEDGWEFPPGTDTSTPEYDPSEELDAKLPPGIVLADDVIFEAPIAVKGMQGLELVTRAIGHASATYGPRDYRHRVMSGPLMLSLWNVSVSGLRIEAANLIQMNQEGKVAKMTVSFQPWPAIKLFHDRMRVRTKGFLSPDYYERVA